VLNTLLDFWGGMYSAEIMTLNPYEAKMRSYFQKLLPLCVLLCLVLTACGDLLPSFIGGGEPLTITIVYGSESRRGSSRWRSLQCRKARNRRGPAHHGRSDPNGLYRIRRRHRLR
jgi:hypothetical protein